MSRFGVGVYRGHLVVYYGLSCVLEIGLENIIRGVECVNEIAKGAGSRSWIRKMKVTRVFRSSKALELVLSRTVQEGYSVRPVHRVI